MAKIKICGLTRTEDIGFVNEAMPDYIGFVFACSKRQIGYHMAKKLKSILDHEIEAVGVFVNEELNFITKCCNDNIIDLVQLHGNEDENYVDELKNLVQKAVIKVIRIGDKPPETISNADYILFDTFNKSHYGGTGETFNWSLLKEYKGQFFLAGGLNIDNIENAVKTTMPYCIDVSSGVETRGIKDKEKIISVVNMIKSLEDN